MAEQANLAGAMQVLAKARAAIRWSKREVAPHEAVHLVGFAREVRDGGMILEIGTALGYSAAVMAAAAPWANIITLNPKEHEFVEATEALRAFPNVTTVMAPSADYLADVSSDIIWDMVFVDGFHNRVAMDFPWFYHLRGGGLMLFHDYSPATAKHRPCAPVYEKVNWMAKTLGRYTPDVLLVDEDQNGLAGFRRSRDDDAVRDIIVGEATLAEAAWRRSTQP